VCHCPRTSLPLPLAPPPHPGYPPIRPPLSKGSLCFWVSRIWRASGRGKCFLGRRKAEGGRRRVEASPPRVDATCVSFPLQIINKADACEVMYIKTCKFDVIPHSRVTNTHARRWKMAPKHPPTHTHTIMMHSLRPFSIAYFSAAFST